MPEDRLIDAVEAGDREDIIEEFGYLRLPSRQWEATLTDKNQFFDCIGDIWTLHFDDRFLLSFQQAYLESGFPDSRSAIRHLRKAKSALDRIVKRYGRFFVIEPPGIDTIFGFSRSKYASFAEADEIRQSGEAPTYRIM
jgi:hypothetical protein